jgi:type IV pilus assembly protein PilA
MRSNKQQGFSLIELLIVVAIILIIAAIAIPNLMRSKMAANEASAVASLRTYNTSIVAYSTTYGTDPSTDLSQLGPSAAPSAAAADLVDSLLGVAAPVKSGYAFTFTPDPAPVGTPKVYSVYTIVAVPAAASTGQRKFFTNQSGVIWQTVDGTAPTAVICVAGNATCTPIG